MVINWKRPGWTWVWHAGENATGAAAIGAGTVLGAAHAHYLSDVPWYMLLSAAGLGALASLLKSIASVCIGPGRDNGTASNVPSVIAKDRIEHSS